MTPELLIALAVASWPAAALVRPPMLEAPDDPYMPRPAEVAEPVPPLPLSGLAGFGVQVNVDAAGDNIPGDAANEPSIAVDPTAPQRIVIGWRQFDTVQSNFRQAGWGYSHDSGRTWTFPGVLEPGIFRSDPVLDADAEGTIYYSSLRGDFSVWFFKSFDGGVTWGGALPAFGGDKQWFTIDRTGGIGHGNIYMSWSTAAGCCGDDIFTRSTDGALSFLTPMALFGNPVWGTLDVASDGTLYLTGVNFSTGIFEVLGSTNAQDPAVDPVFDIGSAVDLGGSIGFGGGPNPGGLLGQISLAVDKSAGPTAGNVYVLCSVDPPGPDPLDVMFARSSDGGITWSPPVRVNDDPPNPNAWQWFGTMSVAPNGRIDVVWNDTRSSGQENVSELFHASSENAGVTWSNNVTLSPPWDSHIGWPDQSKIGDYYDMISDRVGANLAYAATFNGEQDVYFRRIGGFDCNDNGVADADDITAGTSFDINGNGIPDECECLADLDDSGDVGISDFLTLLAVWGTDPGGPPDLDGDGDVGVSDFLIMLARWGACP